jgi:hypothetical protein
MSDDCNQWPIDELLAAYAHAVDPEQRKRFLRAIIRGLTDEVAQVHVRLMTLTSALVMAVGSGTRLDAQAIRAILRRNHPTPAKKEPPTAKRAARVAPGQPRIGRLLKIAAVRGDR